MATLDPGYRYALVKYAGDGSRTDWQIAFDGGYLSQDDVYAYSYVTADRSDRQDLTLSFISEAADESTVRVSPAVAVGRTLVIARLTQRGAPLVDFINRSMLTEKNLNSITQQAIYSVAEIQDAFQELYEDTSGSIDGVLADVLASSQVSAAAQATAAAAVSTANAAATAAASAVATANSASDKGDAAIAQAQSTQASADAATAAAQAATEAADSANALVQGIQDQVDQAVNSANAASEQANNAANTALELGDQIDQANATATDALNVANSIDAKATQAQDDAATAQAAAEQASTDASNAVAAAAAAAPSDNATFTGLTTVEENITSSTVNLVLAAQSVGTVYVRPNGVGSTAGQLSVSATGISWDGYSLWHSNNFNPANYVANNNGYITNSNANNASTTGGYDTASPSTNTPYGDWFTFMHVSAGPGATRAFQLGESWNQPDDLWYRRLNVTWGAWKKVATDGSSPTFGSVSLGSVVTSNPTDLSNHLSLYGNSWGIGMTNGSMNFVGGGNMRWYNGASNIATMSGSGAFTANGGFQSGSSVRLKHQLRPTKRGLADLRKLRVMTGRYRKWFTSDTRKRVFLIAEDIQQHIPEAFAPGAYTIDTGPHKGTYGGYQPEQIIAVLVKAVQELDAELSALKEKING